MKTCAIIMELNPFHQGHAYILDQARKISNCDSLVVITSSYFTQRGLPSVMSLETKTKLCLEHNVDLIIELPFVYSCQGGRQFAKYAIESLSELKIDCLVFGSETNDIEYLEKCYEQHQQIDPSLSYHKNQNKNLKPNDILAMEYIHDCKEYQIQPFCLKRQNQFISASTSRNRLMNHEEIEYKDTCLIQQDWNNYYPYLRTMLQLTSKETLASFFMVNEGIESLLKKNAQLYNDWNSFLSHCTTKTYTKSRIQRTCLWILMQITKEQMKDNSSFHYIKVCGSNQKGRELLKGKENVLSRFNQFPSFLQEVEIKTLALYNSVLQDEIRNQVMIK